MNQNTDTEFSDISSQTSRLKEVAASFLRLGITAYGGPAAHIAMFQDEFVRRRKWLSESHFLDLLGATNLIPGPNSTEMAIHIGYVHAGWRGLVIAGVCFILPAMLIVLGFSWFYVNYGKLPEIVWLLYGIKPVMIAIILQAIFNLGKKAVKGLLLFAVGLAVMLLYFTGIHPLILLFGGGLIYFVLRIIQEKGPGNQLFLPVPLMIVVNTLSSGITYNPMTLFLTFLKIGAVLYGSGYVLLAFLHTEFVQNLGWLTEQQLLDAVALGQVTPGPVFTTATFIGYLVGGVPGALLATLGIFLPSFFFVAISNPFVSRLRESHLLSLILDGVNIAALGLMASVTVVLGREALVDSLTVFILLAAGFLLLRTRLNSTWLILAGGLIGTLKYLLS
jgi:chromate transporter